MDAGGLPGALPWLYAITGAASLEVHPQLSMAPAPTSGPCGSPPPPSLRSGSIGWDLDQIPGGEYLVSSDEFDDIY